MTTGPSPPPLVYEETLPLRWQRLAARPSETEIHRLNDTALATLQVALAWDDSPSPEATEEGGQRAPELFRLELKLNLLLELFAELLSRQGLVPDAIPVRLTPEGLDWETAEPPAPSDYLVLSVYLLPGVPKPVNLPALTRSVQAMGGRYRVHADLLALSPHVQDYLEKLIFRFHRRRVAEARRGRAPIF